MILAALLVFFGILILLVLAHEFGHFFAARRFGVKVEEFGFGLPPRITGVKRGETIYSLNWIPLGGFVRIKGESGEDRDDKDSFSGKTSWQRAVMLLSGVFMNVLLTIILLFFGFMVGLPQIVDEAVDLRNVKEYSIEVAEILKGSPAELSGIKGGDKIISINGKKFSRVSDLSDFIAKSQGMTLDVLVNRGESAMKLKIRPMKYEDRHVLGVKLIPVGIVRYGPLQAMVNSFAATSYFFNETLGAIGRIVKGAFTERKLAADLGGPVAIAFLTAKAVNLGVCHVIQFAALLSLNLAIINAIPFPALDGGRALFLLIEKVARRPLNRKMESWIHKAGFALLMLLIFFITYRDISRFGDRILVIIKKII